MSKFHINDKGEVGPCKARIKACRFGGSETHFKTEAEARQSVEESFGSPFAPVERPRNRSEIKLEERTQAWDKFINELPRMSVIEPSAGSNSVDNLDFYERRNLENETRALVKIGALQYVHDQLLESNHEGASSLPHNAGWFRAFKNVREELVSDLAKSFMGKPEYVVADYVDAMQKIEDNKFAIRDVQDFSDQVEKAREHYLIGLAKRVDALPEDVSRDELRGYDSAIDEMCYLETHDGEEGHFFVRSDNLEVSGTGYLSAGYDVASPLEAAAVEMKNRRFTEEQTQRFLDENNIAYETITSRPIQPDDGLSN